jgi:hypothetical protein
MVDITEIGVREVVVNWFQCLSYTLLYSGLLYPRIRRQRSRENIRTYWVWSEANRIFYFVEVDVVSLVSLWPKSYVHAIWPVYGGERRTSGSVHSVACWAGNWTRDRALLCVVAMRGLPTVLLASSIRHFISLSCYHIWRNIPVVVGWMNQGPESGGACNVRMINRPCVNVISWKCYGKRPFGTPKGIRIKPQDRLLNLRVPWNKISFLGGGGVLNFDQLVADTLTVEAVVVRGMGNLKLSL